MQTPPITSVRLLHLSIVSLVRRRRKYPDKTTEDVALGSYQQLRLDVQCEQRVPCPTVQIILVYFVSRVLVKDYKISQFVAFTIYYSHR